MAKANKEDADKSTPSNPVDGTLAETFSLIYAFLQSRSHEKAAKAVKKAAKSAVILKEDVPPMSGCDLQEIVKQWRAEKLQSDKDDDRSGSDSSGSDSDESSSEEDAKPGLGMRKANGKATSKLHPSSDSNDGGAVESVGVKDADSGSDPTASEEASALKQGTKRKASPSPSSSPSSSSEDKKSKKLITTSAPQFDARATKKRRTSESGEAVVTAVSKRSDDGPPKVKENKRDSRKQNNPFQRIKVETVTFHDERLKDNSFSSKGGATGDYGAKAAADLVVTRGAGFRKEKNKKKRGSYRGGQITMQSHSIKFA